MYLVQISFIIKVNENLTKMDFYILWAHITEDWMSNKGNHLLLLYNKVEHQINVYISYFYKIWEKSKHNVSSIWTKKMVTLVKFLISYQKHMRRKLN